MAKVDFVNQLKALGYETQEPDAAKVYFEWEVPVGKNIGKRVLIGFEVSADFPMNCPPGPHIKSLTDGWKEHPNNINPSPPFGADWRYWSRPFVDWNRSDRTVKAYLAHIKNVMMSI